MARDSVPLSLFGQLVRWLPVLAVSGVVAAGCSTATKETAPTTAPTSTPTTSGGSTATTSTTRGSAPPTTKTTTPSSPKPCQGSAFTVRRTGASVAAGEVAIGFRIANVSADDCTLEGFPTIALIPASGTTDPVVTHLGAAQPVRIVTGGSAGFVLEYSDVQVSGEGACPSMDGVEVHLPSVGGAPMLVTTTFRPCGKPNISVSAILSAAQFERAVS